VNVGLDGILALSLAVGLFVLWSALGSAILSGFKTGVDGGRRLLVAPAVGAAACVLPIFWINWWGVPIRQIAWPLLVVLAVIASALFWMRRPTDVRPDILPLAMPLAAALVLNGWPLFTHGFAWLSYANDDMATYCLMAARVIDHGLLEPPSAHVLRTSSDLAANMWLFDSSFGRPGSHLLIAWVASIAQRSVLEVYMPVLIAMHLALVAAAGGLVWRESSQRRAVFVTCWLLAASALTALGTVSQLLPQVFGLALACAFLALVWDIDRPPFGIGRALVAGGTGASLLIGYLEVAPFVAVPWFVRLLTLRLWRRDRQRALWTLGGVVGCGLVVDAPYLGRFVPFMVRQATDGFRSASEFERFPYFRFSTAFANLWGFLPIARRVPEPVLSIAIVAGALAFAALFVVLVRPLLRRDAAPAILLFMLLFGVVLFARGNGFGLFKLAMYAQPFMLGTVALVLVPGSKAAPTRSRWLAIVLIAALGLPTQVYYMRSSVNPALARMDIQNPRGAMHELLGLRGFRGRSLDVDLPVTAAAKLSGLFLRDIPLRFIGLPAFFLPRGDPSAISNRLQSEASALRTVVREVSGVPRQFELRDRRLPAMSNAFLLTGRLSAPGTAPPACDSVLTTTAAQSIVNRTTTGAAVGTFRMLSCRTITNHLAFVSSALGRHYYLAIPGADPIGMFALEPDYFFPGRRFAGVGRYLLFEVLQPGPDARLVLDFTSSLKADRANLLPPVEVIGDQRVSLPAVGRGSARWYSAPLAPQWIDGHAYVGVDFGVEGTRYPDTRRGLMRWLGRDIPVDSRVLVGLARNISLVSEAEYQRMVPPENIERFPQDLGAPALEYSGIYEDGWVADDAIVHLRRPSGPGALTVKGNLLPASSGSGTTITIDLDGATAFSERRAPGPFAIEAPVPAADGDRMAVRLKFSTMRPLSDRDRRPASAHIEYLGVARAPVSK
jgi:hypothetical protein